MLLRLPGRFSPKRNTTGLEIDKYSLHIVIPQKIVMGWSCSISGDQTIVGAPFTRKYVVFSKRISRQEGGGASFCGLKKQFGTEVLMLCPVVELVKNVE